MEKKEHTPNQILTNYCNIASTFSGIGNIILDINSVVLDAISRYSLVIEECPYETIHLHFQYILQNLRKYQLKDILCFYEHTGYPHFDLAVAVINDGSFQPYIQIKDSLENKRIALALCNQGRSDLTHFFSSSGLYVGMLDYLIFEIPFVFTVVIDPYEVIDPAARYTTDHGDRSELSVEVRRQCLSLEKHSESISEEEARKLLSNALLDKKICTSNEQHESNTCNDTPMDRSVFNIKPELPWSGEDLNQIIPPVPEKTSQKHLANIRRSAMSMYDGRFHYSTVVRETAEKPKKVSGKMLKIIQENEERLRKEKEKTDNNWLKNFYLSYSKVPSLKGKKMLLEKTKINNDYINRKLLLLKIELYSDIWSLEKRSENVDERVLVPLYINCLKYIDEYSSAECYFKDELEFVMNKLIEAGFEATVCEILATLGSRVQLSLELSPNASPAPNDLDLYFQLKYAGDHLKRTLGTRKDKRVPFDPDKWQVQLLDAVDANKSAVVAAPTSSGKTFICFYAIEKVLRSSDTDVVIFCLPTKALVNQVSADIYARFNPKNVKTALQGTLMTDRCNEPFNCQVLITVPAMLESLLNSRDCSNIKYIIIDEVHKINDSSLGIKIERIIHLARCPLLLLSATLGNLNKFYEWFKNVENSKGRECELVYHNERYCELKSFVYTEKRFVEDEETNETNEESCKDTPIKPALVPLNGLFPYSFAHLKNFGFGNDLHFLPEELLNIYLYIYTVLDSSHKKLIKSLAPKKFFKSNRICKADVREYQHHLLNTFRDWVNEGILNEDQVQEIHNLLTADSHDAFNFDSSENYIVENILKLLNTLKDSEMLPVIVFNTNRDFVTRLARLVYEKLEALDTMKKRDKMLEKMKKEAKRTRDAEKTKDSWIEDSIASEQMVEPEQRDIRFTFLDPVTKLTDYDVREEFSDIKAVPKDILDMAYRGIGIHHSAMNRKYRSAVEILFRKKHIRVLFATETLALGINMPCRTVVFAGDSLQLDPMNYKQMSGRAGRRGYDTLGNVVFFGIPKHRVQNLMVSMLPEVQGAYTYSHHSLISFNIEESIIRYPLLNSSHEENIVEKMDQLYVQDGRQAVVTLDYFNTQEARKSLVEYQRSIYPHVYPSSYLWDLFISNREFDPSIFVFALLYESNQIDWSSNEFMKLVAHLFEVRPVHSRFEFSLPPLSSKVSEAIAHINSIYIQDLVKFCPESIKKLQEKTNKPLFHLKSFLYVYDTPKNSYILDFYDHGSSFKIRKNNQILEGELWISLNNVSTFIKSLLKLMELHCDSQDERLKKVRQVEAEFTRKFKQIFA